MGRLNSPFFISGGKKMILTINNKNYELQFGLGFLAEMNKRKSAQFEGMATGYGAMQILQMGMMMGDPLALLDLIKVATAHCPQKPSNAELEQYLTELAINKQITNVFESIFNEIKKSPILAYAMKITPTEEVIPTEVIPTEVQPTVQPQVITPTTTV